MSDNTLEKTERLEVFSSASNLMAQTLDKKYLKSLSELSHQNMTSGFHAIDKITKGYHLGELVTIAVRPGIGKTSFLLSMLNNIGLCESHSCGIFSLERTSKQMMKRLIQSTTGIAVDKINSGHLNDIECNHVRSVVNSIANAKLLFDDTAGISTDTLKEKAKKMLELGAEIIIVDYLEMLHSNNTASNCEEEDLCNVMIDLHQIAKELQIPVIVFSQLKKPVIYKTKYKYTPDYINDNTDTLIFLNRPSYYHINQIDKIAEDVAEITIAKNINIGEMQIVNLRIIESLGQFKDLN
jgi:replicative DNA helicase